MGYAFISYSSAQQRQLNAVKEFLQRNNISFWSAPDDIPIGSKYSEEIKRAIENASCVLFLLSDDSQNSTYCNLEIALALKLEKPIIPIQLEDVILNDSFSLYLSSSSEFFPLPGKITTSKSNKLLSQLLLLCVDPNEEPAEPLDPSYKIGFFRKGTWMQLLGWLWIIGGFKPFSALADIFFPVPPRYDSYGGDGLDGFNAPLIADSVFKQGLLLSALLLIGLLLVCSGFSLNRKQHGTERLFFQHFSISQILLLVSFACLGISFPLASLNIGSHLDHYYSSFMVTISNYMFCLSLILFFITLVVWLCLRIRQLYRYWNGKGKG